MQQGPFAPRVLPRFNTVGSEGAHRSADPRPPLKPDRRCCTALAESEIRLWWWPRYVRA